MRPRLATLAALLALGIPAALAAQTSAPRHAPAPPRRPPAHPYYPSVTVDRATMHQLLATPAPQPTAKPKPTAKPAFTPQVFGTHSTSEGQ
jgi:hypothetical protein